ncbi:hypothetical protein CAPTEDRAFT_197539 [Capitella teleta]|uniref:Uncharacterized protein n=1 Tax=Capitella teleta TaxID=283909 RepID=R7UNV4_CAPTE|nr:hypothetical protein CAPTEDRAFT_197539 [Capitella teleta]|eukprot:ELU08219.1 hypothetical protein CAPTEDRAFT_197539 [Capitella teleta]
MSKELIHTRLEMLRIVEQGLQLKLEIREIKDDFLRIVNTYEEYATLDDKYNRLFNTRSTKIPDPGTDKFIASIQARDLKLKLRKREAETKASFTDLSSISQATSCSREGVLTDVTGPLHSTQMSASAESGVDEELPMLSAIDSDEFDGDMETRLDPVGSDDRGTRSHPVGSSVSSLLNFVNLTSDADESTPKAVPRSKLVLGYLPSPASDSGAASILTLVGPDSTRRMSRGRYSAFSDTSRGDPNPFPRLNLSNSQNSISHNSDSGNHSGTQYSMEATRDSLAQPSMLTMSSADNLLSVDTTDPSSIGLSSCTNNSSYKESDGQTSFDLSSTRSEFIMPKPRLDYNGMTSTSTSAGSLSSVGTKAPMNTPNCSLAESERTSLDGGVEPRARRVLVVDMASFGDQSSREEEDTEEAEFELRGNKKGKTPKRKTPSLWKKTQSFARRFKAGLKNKSGSS